MALSRPQDDADSESTLADAILDDMRSTGRSISPHQFEFWYHYKVGHNPALNAAADDLMARKGDISADEIEQLYQQYLSPWRHSRGCEAVTGRLSGQLQDLSASIDEAIGLVVSQRQALMAEARDLSGGGALTLQRAIQAIDLLVQSAKEGKLRQAVLGAKLDAARRDINAIRTELGIVRTEGETDRATGLVSHAVFLRSLTKAVDETGRGGEPLALIVANLDYFGDFNRNFGRATGDRILRSVGVLLTLHLRPSDVVARLVGDELAAILPKARIDEASALADQIRQVLMGNELVRDQVGNHPGRLTVSIGVAAYAAGDDRDRLLARAQAGLAVAKKEGRNRVVVMTPDGPVWSASRVA
jgi:diguanylate cyclase